MNRRQFLTAAAVSAIGTQSGIAANADPPWVQVVRELFTHHFQHYQVFSDLKKAEKWFSKRLAKAFAREDRQNVKTTSNGLAPHIHGAPITLSQEQPSRFEITGSHQHRDFAFVYLDLIWEWGPPGTDGDRTSRFVLVVLRRENESWLIDDMVHYEDALDYARNLRGVLSENDPR